MPKYTFTNNENGKKLLQLLSENTDGVSRSVLTHQVKIGEVRVNGEKVKENVVLSCGDEVNLFVPTGAVKIIEPKIVYNDENIVIVDKSVNADTENNLVRTVSAKVGCKVYAVHRLDRNTEGLVILAKDTESEGLLKDAIKNRKIVKVYRALLFGKFEKKEFTDTAYLIKHEKNSKVTVFDKPQRGAKTIVTHFKVLAEFEDYCDVEIVLVTGRTHQIRAHAAYLKHPVLGDGKYSTNAINNRFGYKYQQLKAVRLNFIKVEGKLGYLNGKEISVEQ